MTRPTTAATRIGAALLGALLMIGVGAGPASASKLLDDQPSVRNKVQILEGRHTIAPMFGLTLNDDYVTNLLGGLSYRYYLESWLGIGVNLAAGAGLDTSLTGQINSEITALNNGQTFTLSTTSLRLAADATLELVPFEGKFMIFGALARMDVHIQVGFGIALVGGTDRIEDTVSLMPTFGFGLRFFPEEWIAVGIDVRDLLVNRTLSSRRDGSVPGATFGHNWLLGLSVGFFLPTEPEVRP